MLDFREIIGTQSLSLGVSGLVPSWPHKGTTSTKKEFTIDNDPTGDGYVLVQSYDVQTSPKFYVNDIEQGWIIARHSDKKAWETWASPIYDLKKGKNTIHFTTKVSGGMAIANVIVHWRFIE